MFDVRIEGDVAGARSPEIQARIAEARARAQEARVEKPPEAAPAEGPAPPEAHRGKPGRPTEAGEKDPATQAIAAVAESARGSSGMTTDELRARTGIPEERFDPKWWKNDNYGKGARPPDKVIWDHWTPEQRAEAGLPEWSDYKEATNAWRARFQPGGDIHQAHRDQEAGLRQLAAQGWDLSDRATFAKALNAVGLFDRHEEGRARYRGLMMRFDGSSDATGHYHYDLRAGTKINVATSDLSARGIPVPMTEEDWAWVNMDPLDRVFA